MCLRPLHYFKSDLLNEDGDEQGFITGYQLKEACYNDFLAHKINCSLAYRCKPVVVPCGKCVECKRAIKYRWVGRCIAEMENCKNTYFLTLTFNDENLHDCCKSDIQKFIKRLRHHIKLSYLAVGEYGNLHNRPHYHLIIFTNDDLNDLHILKRSKLPIYRSELIESCWPFGNSSVGFGSASSIAYCIGYLMNKEKNTAFKLQSQGLGSKFFSDLKEKYYLSDGRGKEIIVYLPRYLKKKYGIEFEYDKELDELKFKNDLSNYDMPEHQYRDFKEYLAESKLAK